MQEVEVKAWLKNRQAVEQFLAKLGCELSSPISQKDRVFISREITFNQIRPGTNVLRLRDEDGKIIFTFKQPGVVQLQKLEHEVTVSDAEEMTRILEHLGYYQVTAFNKVRQKCKFGKYEICLDEVEGLGSFIEVEQLVADGDLDAVTVGLWQFLGTLGVKPEDRVLVGYDVLMYNRLKENSKSQASNSK